jgi:ABC-type phosphate transport system auxiliary subunit
MKKFMDLNENDSIETIASVLKTELDNYKKEYEEMKKDGVIDEEEQKRIITTMSELENKAKELKTKIENENTKKIMDEIINIISDEQNKITNVNTQEIEVSDDKTLN